MKENISQFAGDDAIDIGVGDVITGAITTASIITTLML